MRKVHWQKASESVSLDRAVSQGMEQRVTHPFVMVIDDSATFRKIMETCLHRKGYVVKSFPDGIEAIRWLTQGPACVPDLLFLDIGLPKIDGYEVAHYLKAKPPWRHVAIILVSGRNGIIDRLKGHLVGAEAYLTKPVQTQEILQLVDSWLHERTS